MGVALVTTTPVDSLANAGFLPTQPRFLLSPRSLFQTERCSHQETQKQYHWTLTHPLWAPHSSQLIGKEGSYDTGWVTGLYNTGKLDSSFTVEVRRGTSRMEEIPSGVSQYYWVLWSIPVENYSNPIQGGPARARPCRDDCFGCHIRWRTSWGAFWQQKENKTVIDCSCHDYFFLNLF